jgi:hypothetical protein
MGVAIFGRVGPRLIKPMRKMSDEQQPASSALKMRNTATKCFARVLPLGAKVRPALGLSGDQTPRRA